MACANRELAAVNSVVVPVIWSVSLFQPVPKMIVPGRAGEAMTLAEAVLATLGISEADGLALGDGVGDGVSAAMFGAGGISPERMSPSTMAPRIAAIAPPIAVSEA